MPSPSRIPRCKPKTVKNPSISDVKPTQPELPERENPKTRWTTHQKRNLKHPTSVLHTENIKKLDLNNKRTADRRGITEIKRSESALMQKLHDLENVQDATQKELIEKNALLDRFTASEAHLTKEINLLKSQYSRLCLSMEENGFDPVTTTKFKGMDHISTEVENSEKCAKMDAEQMVEGLSVLDKLCDETTEKLNSLVFPSVKSPTN